MNKIKKMLILTIIITVGLIDSSYAADIKGKIVINSRTSTSKSTGLSALYMKNSSQKISNIEKRAVVYIKNFEGAPPPTPVVGKKITQKNIAFDPHLLVVTAGSSVGFPNMDSVYHNVFSLTKNADFDLGRYAMGKSKSKTFNKPALVEVFCEIHSNMFAYIFVVPNDFYTISDENSEFQISNLPPGNYVIAVWIEGLGQKEQEITVPVNGDLDLTIEF